MHYRQLGKTDLHLSEVCFGPMRFDPTVTNELGQNALDRALEHGINVIHSSYEYKTIDQLGECLAKQPRKNDLHHIIKVSSPDYNEKGFDKALFRRRIEDALRTLHTERIDVVQHLHRSVGPDIVYHTEGDGTRFGQMPAVVEELTEAFEELKQEGKVGFLASFPMTTGYADLVVKSGKFDCLVGYYNLIETEMAEFFPAMKEQGMAFIAVRPLLRGLLTDKRANRSELPSEDPLKDTSWDQAYQMFEQIQAKLPEIEMPWETFAVKFCLANPFVTTLALGLNTPEQVDAAVASANGDYPAMELVNEVMNLNKENRPAKYSWPPYEKL